MNHLKMLYTNKNYEKWILTLTIHPRVVNSYFIFAFRYEKFLCRFMLVYND